jgi:hypothetical protein
MGDMNAKLGKENVFSLVIGRHTLHNTSNENKKKYLVSGQKESYVQYTKKGDKNNAITTEGYPY